MKNMTKVLVSVALSGSLFFSTLGESAQAKEMTAYEDGKYIVFKNTYVGAGDDSYHENSYLLSDTGKKINVILTEEVVYHLWDNGTKGKNASFNIRLSNNKRLKVKNGVIYSKGKIYTGSMSTKQVKVKEYDGTNAYYWNKVIVRKGHIYKGSTYVKRILMGSQPG